MTLFGKPLLDFFIPPVLKSTNLSLQEVLLGVGGNGGSGLIPYATSILSAVAALISFCYIVYAGYIMFTAFGDESKYALGKKTLQWAIIGFGISMLSYFFIHFFVSLLGYTP